MLSSICKTSHEGHFVEGSLSQDGPSTTVDCLWALLWKYLWSLSRLVSELWWHIWLLDILWEVISFRRFWTNIGIGFCGFSSNVEHTVSLSTISGQSLATGVTQSHSLGILFQWEQLRVPVLECWVALLGVARALENTRLTLAVTVEYRYTVAEHVFNKQWSRTVCIHLLLGI